MKTFHVWSSNDADDCITVTTAAQALSTKRRLEGEGFYAYVTDEEDRFVSEAALALFCHGNEAETDADAEVLPGATASEILVVDVTALLNCGEVDFPQSVPEWQWIEDKASFRHVGNGKTPGVWEFVVNTANHLHPIPERLLPAFIAARNRVASYIVFMQ